jgi:glyoxylase-like metal-dependent hydrolase (beta-lactamase superfamily II)
MYDGNVAVDGPAQSREVGGLTITKVAVGDFNNNAYLLVDSATGEQLLIDAAASAPVLLGLVGPDPHALGQIVTTHRHQDHWFALADVVAASGATTLTGIHDAEGIEVPTEIALSPGDTISVGESSLEVIELVGHTPGAIALLYEGDPERPHLFTGDSLFPGGPGNTRGNVEDFTSLMNDLEAKVFGRLPDETWVYAGHGADTTLGAERPSLPEWRARGW